MQTNFDFFVSSNSYGFGHILYMDFANEIIRNLAPVSLIPCIYTCRSLRFWISRYHSDIIRSLPLFPIESDIKQKSIYATGFRREMIYITRNSSMVTCLTWLNKIMSFWEKNTIIFDNNDRLYSYITQKIYINHCNVNILELPYYMLCHSNTISFGRAICSRLAFIVLIRPKYRKGTSKAKSINTIHEYAYPPKTRFQIINNTAHDMKYTLIGRDQGGGWSIQKRLLILEEL